MTNQTQLKTDNRQHETTASQTLRLPNGPSPSGAASLQRMIVDTISEVELRNSGAEQSELNKVLMRAAVIDRAFAPDKPDIEGISETFEHYRSLVEEETNFTYNFGQAEASIGALEEVDLSLEQTNGILAAAALANVDPIYSGPIQPGRVLYQNGIAGLFVAEDQVSVICTPQEFFSSGMESLDMFGTGTLYDLNPHIEAVGDENLTIVSGALLKNQ